jgi:hypothetical protein
MGIRYRGRRLSLTDASSATCRDIEKKIYIGAVKLAKSQIHTFGPRLQPLGALANASSRDGVEFGMSFSVTRRHDALEPTHLLVVALVFPAITLRVTKPLAADHARLHLMREPKNLIQKIGNLVSLPRYHWSIPRALGRVLRLYLCVGQRRSKRYPKDQSRQLRLD